MSENAEIGWARFVELFSATVAERRFTIGTVSEAVDLARNSDAIFTRGDGLTLEIIVVLNRIDDHPIHGTPTKAIIEQIGMACLPHTKSGTGQRSIFISIVEIGLAPLSEGATAHLSPLVNESPLATVQIAAYAADLSTCDIWTNKPFFGRGVSFLLGDAMVRMGCRDPNTPVYVAPPTFNPEPPIATATILVVLALLFFASVAIDGATGTLMDIEVGTLVKLGGQRGDLIFDNGHWWRLFWATYLHANLLHVGANCLVLALIGHSLEPVIGRAWFLAAYLVSGPVGSLISTAFNDHDVTSVGASGAIMGLLACALVVSYHFDPESKQRKSLQDGSAGLLFPSLLPSATGNVDVASHIGGAICGAGLGFLLLRSWSYVEPYPRHQMMAWTVCLLCLVATIAGRLIAT